MSLHQTKRKIQYWAGLCAASNFMFTGAVISWPSPAIPKFQSGEADVQITEAQISWISSLFAIGAILGCFIGHPLLDHVGRRKALLCGTLPGIIGAGIILFTKSAEMLYFPRILCGVSLGMTAVVVMIYITEIADKEIRGALGMSVQVTNNLGSLLVYCIGPFVTYNMLNALVLAIPLANLLSCLWIPESPYYHVKDGRIAAARIEFMKLKGTNDEKWVDEQLGIIRAHVRESMENKTTLWELVSNMKYRRALYIVSGLKMLQYMTGGMAIQAYLEVIFRQSSSISGPLVSIVYGFVQVITGVGGALLAGYFGRRILMFVSDLGVALSMSALGLYFYLQDTVKLSPETLSTISFLPLMGLFGFNIFYSVGIGMLPYVMQAELFPINVKTAASSSATVMACVMSFVITKCYHGIRAGLGHSAVFWAFAIVGYLGLFFIYFFVPETKDKTLEEVQDNMQEKNQEATALKDMEDIS
ncbi:facilitated trehalose transporter Tret1-like isoform X1 [Cydia pomonella]|uniref:facilitated trehalose transporter Tret1-like isoform X1 n=1 Tax=Cydia pomonella TaxID=82600 RepID=UPI002ADD531F|nr:facilitated trehalose transporter Tret1-like isoform X1 [Cydia pomonella]